MTDSFIFIKKFLQACRMSTNNVIRLYDIRNVHVGYIRGYMYENVRRYITDMYVCTSTRTCICRMLAEPRRKPDDRIGPRTVWYSQVSLHLNIVQLCFGNYVQLMI